MIKIPNYIECLAKVISFLGIDFDEKVKKTNDFRMGERNEFNTQKIHYAKYTLKILDLLAGKDEEKRYFIETYLDISENIARELTSKNYYTLATNKMVMSGLLVFYYIPHIASLIAFHDKEFGIPACLIEHDFMLPHFDENKKIVCPMKKLKVYLRTIKNEIPTKFNDDSNPLKEEYIEILGEYSVPRYKKYDEIIGFLRKISTFQERINEISLIIRIAIVSGHIYHELLCIFDRDENYVISLIDFFRKFLITSERLFKGNNEIQSDFEGQVEIYLEYYNNLILYSIATRKNLWLSIKENKKNLRINDFEHIKENNERIIFKSFESFLNTTKDNNEDSVLKIGIENLIRFPKEFIEVYDNNQMSDFKYLLDELDDVFTNYNILEENQIEILLKKFINHKYYDNYVHEFLYYESLNYLGQYELDNALTKIKMSAERCENITAGETKIKIAEKFIILKLLNNPKETSITSHLNPAIKIMIDAKKQGLSITPILDSEINISEEEIHKRIYLLTVLEIMNKFNAEGYARYENVECIKYNPFEKFENFVGDFYDFYENDIKTYESEKIKVRKIIKKLTAQKMPYHNNLVTLCQYKAIDVFNPINFKMIRVFLDFSKIESKNIYRLNEDKRMREIIYEVVST